MTVTASIARPSPLAALFDRYHVAWEKRNANAIASLHSEDTMFWLHDGSEPVQGRDALRQHCAALFDAYAFSLVVDRLLFGDDHWILEWTMVLSLADLDGHPFTARVEMLDVVTVNARGEVARKDVYLNGKQSQQALSRAGMQR